MLWSGKWMPRREDLAYSIARMLSYSGDVSNLSENQLNGKLVLCPAVVGLQYTIARAFLASWTQLPYVQLVSG